MDNARDDSARERRLAQRMKLYILHRAAETSDQREERLARRREYMRRRRASIADEERQAYHNEEKPTTMRILSIQQVLFFRLMIPLLLQS